MCYLHLHFALITYFFDQHYVPPGDGYPNLSAWMEHCASTMMNYKTDNEVGADALGLYVVQQISEQ